MIRNQCDGCVRGLPLVDGQHLGEGYDSIGCTAHLYESASQPEEEGEAAMRTSDVAKVAGHLADDPEAEVRVRALTEWDTAFSDRYVELSQGRYDSYPEAVAQAAGNAAIIMEVFGVTFDPRKGAELMHRIECAKDRVIRGDGS